MANSVVIADKSHIRFIKAAMRILGRNFGMGLPAQMAKSDDTALIPLFSSEEQVYDTQSALQEDGL